MSQSSTIERLYQKLLTKVFVISNGFNSLTYRRARFDAIASNEEFQYSSRVGEHYVVIPSDVGVSKHVYIDGHFGWANVEKAIALLGDNFKLETFIDIGANIGTICIPVVRRGLAKRAIAFEPEPKNFRVLVANIYLNDLADKITFHNLALGAESNKELTFELSPDNGGDHRVKVREDDGLYDESSRKQIKVKSEKLDDIIANINEKNSLIWMDTQGYEGYIMKGAENALNKKVPMVTEFWPYGLDRANCYQYFKEACLKYDNYYDLSVDQPTLMKMSENAMDDLYAKFSGGDDNTDLLLV